MNYLSLHCPDDRQLHTEVEVLNRHVVDLPERVAGLPKELESRESLIPYDYDLSIEDPQYRVVENSIVELDVKVLAAVQSPPIAFLQRGSLEQSQQQQEEEASSSSAQTNNSPEAGQPGCKQRTAACCGEQLKLDPPSLLAANIPVAEASGDDTAISVGQVDVAIPGEKSHHSEQKKQKQKQKTQQRQRH